MFSISKLNLNTKKNSKIVLSKFHKGAYFSMLILFESSASSDTGHFIFIQQNCCDSNIKIKKLIWISESVVYGFANNPSSDWLAVSLRGGVICILPLGTLLGRVQKKCEHWKTNDVTYLPNKLKHDSPVTCMEWWTSSKNKQTCLIGKANGDFLIVDLSNGSLLYSEKFTDYIQSIDLLFEMNGNFSYCIVTTKELVQWKLLLEEIHVNQPIFDKEFGFETLDFSAMHSSCILESKIKKKSKGEQIINPTYVPTRLYQFSETTYLKGQYYNGKYFLGAYDRSNGKYKLFDCENLDSSLYEFQLPLNVLKICVTEELLFLIVGHPNDLTLSNVDVPLAFQQKKPLKLCIICRQYAQNHLFEKYKSQISSSKGSNAGIYKPSIPEVVQNVLTKCVLFEFKLEEVLSMEDIIDIVDLPLFFNFFDYEKSIPSDGSVVSLRNQNWLDFIKQIRRNPTITTSNQENPKSKWCLEEIKLFSPIFVIGKNGIFICHLSQCFEDKFIDCLLENDTKGAEWLGAGLRLDMNYLYTYTAQLLASGNAQLSSSVTKSQKALILEFFNLGYTSIVDKLACLTKYWSIEECLQFSLTLLVNINSISPIDRSILSNSLIPMFGYVMSDPVDLIEGTMNKKKTYHEKFRRFVMSNCFFNDLKAAKIMIEFGEVDEAFFIAKEKGCVIELFRFLMENNYNTNWPLCFDDIILQNKFLILDRDLVLSNIKLMDFEIVARSDPKLIKCFAEFICQSFMNNIDIFSFKTTSHLCMILNPYCSIIDTLFHIYSCTTTHETGFVKKEKDLSAIFEKKLTSSTESLTDTSTFSKTLKIRREIGPELLAFCLLVISRDNQINIVNDHIYFIQLYGVINSKADKKVLHEESYENGMVNSLKKEPVSINLFESLETKKGFIVKKKLLSSYWQDNIQKKYLSLRHDFCISISVFEIDLFEDDNKSDIKKCRSNSISHQQVKTKKTSAHYFSDPICRERCQVNMLGFQNNATSRVLLMPKSIESGKEVIRQIVLGKQHVLILSNSGSVYTAGSNAYGQLGIEKSLLNETNINRKNYGLNVINPQLINMNLGNSEIVVSIAAGDFHSGAIIVNTADSEQKSEVSTWGWGVHGQLGHSDTEDQRFPKRLLWNIGECQEFPIQLTMGCFHSIMLTNKGNVYSFGNNSYGQLGRPGFQKSSEPILVQNLPQNVKHVDTKYFHTVCSTELNQIFSWGIDPNLWQNQLNQNKSHDSISTPTMIETKNLLATEKIVQISCGSTHTTILTERKFVYSFGANMWGQLGLGNRKEYNELVEVKLSSSIDFISTDNGITVGMRLGEKNTKLFVWGRCSHPLIHDNLKELSSDTVKPQILTEFVHSLSSNPMNENCFGIDALSNVGSTILNKNQLMIFFRNCSEYLDRNKLISVLRSLKELDIIADFFLINEMLIESLFWRIKSLTERIEKDYIKESPELFKEDVAIIFNFYIRVADGIKKPIGMKTIFTMITGFFKRQKLPWNIFEQICTPLLYKNARIISKLIVEHSLGEELTSTFLRNLILNITDESIDELLVRPSLGNIVLSSIDIQRFYDLIKAGSSETIYDAADDHKVVFFAGCVHAAVLGRYREQQVKLFIEKLRRKQLNFSTPMIQRLYNDSTILPDCLECLSQRI